MSIITWTSPVDHLPLRKVLAGIFFVWERMGYINASGQVLRVKLEKLKLAQSRGLEFNEPMVPPYFSFLPSLSLLSFTP
jgi:hypothetical protein